MLKALLRRVSRIMDAQEQVLPQLQRLAQTLQSGEPFCATDAEQY